MSKIKSLNDGDSIMEIIDDKIGICTTNELVTFDIDMVSSLITKYKDNKATNNKFMMICEFKTRYFGTYHYHSLMSPIEVRKNLRLLYTCFNSEEYNEVSFGEIEGKHSDICIDNNHLSLLVLTDPEVISDYVDKHGLHKEDCDWSYQFDDAMFEQFVDSDIESFNQSLEVLHNNSDFELVSDEVIELLKLKGGEVDTPYED